MDGRVSVLVSTSLLQIAIAPELDSLLSNVLQILMYRE